MKPATQRILFVCTGNICRSPSAEGVFRHLVETEGCAQAFSLDSAGIIAYHVGEAPDRRSVAEAKHRGVDLSSLRARQVNQDDFRNFDLLMAMDYSHYDDLKSMAPAGFESKVHLFLEPIRDRLQLSEVPDPYYGGPDGFSRVYDLIQDACEAWLGKLR